MNPFKLNDQPDDPPADDDIYRQLNDLHAGRRHPGGQPGNRNARKHGFYPKSYRGREASDLAASDFFVLMDEIALIRVFIRRVALLAKQVDDPYFNLDVLRTMSLAAASLSRLIRAQSDLGEIAGEHDLQEALSEALANVHAQLIMEGAPIDGYSHLSISQPSTFNLQPLPQSILFAPQKRPPRQTLLLRLPSNPRPTSPIFNLQFSTFNL